MPAIAEIPGLPDPPTLMARRVEMEQEMATLQARIALAEQTDQIRDPETGQPGATTGPTPALVPVMLWLDAARAKVMPRAAAASQTVTDWRAGAWPDRPRGGGGHGPRDDQGVDGVLDGGPGELARDPCPGGWSAGQG